MVFFSKPILMIPHFSTLRKCPYFFCIVMFKICQFLRALIHNVTTAFIRSTHFKNFFFLRTYPVFHSITMWRMTASIFLKIYSIVDANRWIPLCTKITKSYFEKKSCFVGRINLPLPSLNLF